uniref:Cold shock domain containing C2 n=1 Tax=Lynx canadensis TaxID=61383 RepID=A0A667GDU8_LYNCA
MTSEPTSPPVVPPLHSPKSPVWPTFPFHREGSRVWERGGVSSRDLPSPLPTKRTRTYSATARASAGPVFKGVCKQFSRSQGHGFITPENGSEDIFVHVSDIEGEYVPVEGDEVTYKMCPIPPKNQKFQAVEALLILRPCSDPLAAEDPVMQTHVPSGRARHGHLQDGPQPVTPPALQPLAGLFLQL